ncbi:MAG: BamA/TamA family outer membrane protein [Candidatus Eisenbacteria bacterium]|uniref:BamA/TamA family outer membrane protein n=1 Tax=Eiseniibacteriota bacterium TaxID=2212470 RepID=A0A948RTN9_UNCEI|nr:BamA/TamA family outer membrane protein [Candidatus Eisenbacteria bacterium]MBU1950067.1 BamA/TamA family outer membrane protein [Candidatus Eisenbacteria bacterium]MBU2690351.1 BamA/TamA family outer membrane protein [Candidatus Eisenbacteria bacterium]
MLIRRPLLEKLPKIRGFRILLGTALLACSALTLLPQTASAQYFGRNKVHYRNLKWAVTETDHFDIYYYESEKGSAADAAMMAERAYARLSRILNHDVEDKIPLILYASQTDFQESNVSSGLIGEGTGGLTEFLKRRVTLPFTGSLAQFDQVLTHELVHAFQIDILWGSKEGRLRNAFSYSPPLWVMEGMAEYLSTGYVDDHTRMWLRDGALQGYLTSIPDLNYVYDIRVYRYGQAIMAYIGQTYGDETIGLLFKTMTRTRNLSFAVEEVLGMNLEKLSDNWTESVRRTYLPQIAEHEKAVSFAKQLTRHDWDGSSINLSPAVSPDGSLMVYLSDRSLYNDLYLASAIDGKVIHRLIKGERREAFESLRFLDATFAWAPDNTRLAFSAKVGDRDALYIMDVRKKKILHRHLFNIEGLQAPSWSPDGQQITFVGLRGGRSDLFIVDADGKNVRALTNDRFMVREPQFSPDGKKIAFVTDRGPDTDWGNLIFSKPEIAIFYLETEEIEVLSGQEGKNISPYWFPDGKRIAYVTDRSGISNINIRDIETGQDGPITDILTGVTGIVPWGTPISLARDGRRLLFTSFSIGGWDIYAIKDPIDRWRKEGAPARDVPEKGPAFVVVHSSPPGGEILDLTDLPPLADEPDSAAMLPASPINPKDWMGPPWPVDDPLIAGVDTFEVVLQEHPHDRFRGGEGAFRFKDPVPEEPIDILQVFAETKELPDSSSHLIRGYKPRFSVDYVSANGFFATNVGLGAQSLLYFSDILGDHNIVVGADIYGSLEDANLLLQYYNMKNRIHWGAGAFQFRNDFYIFAAQSSDEFISQIYRGVELSLSRPFSRFRRLELRLQALNVDEMVYQESFEASNYYSLDRQDKYTYFSPGLALVKDTTLFGPTGPISGSRYRYSVDGAVGDLSYITLLMDHREYLNVRQRYALALRLVAASSYGGDPQIFRIGGPFTMRGYDYGELEGTRIAFTNIEFRFPLVDQLRLGWPLKLEFRGIRGAFYFDLGAAWTEAEHFRAFGTDDQGRRHLEDLRASYGLGASMNLGFLILRWDLAQATDLVRGTRKARGELIFGTDF